VGYCSNWINPAIAGEPWAGGTASPRLIVPTSRYTYLARRTDGKADAKGAKKQYYEKLFVGGRYPFNLKALQNSQGKPIFVVEGELDALSIIDAGGVAIGLGGSTGGKYLLEALQKNYYFRKLIFVPDADGKQDKTFSGLCKQVQEMGIDAEIMDGGILFGTAKDANEALQADRQGFAERLGAVQGMREAKTASPYGRARVAFQKALANGTLKKTPTGVKIIDELFCGGLSPRTLIMLGGQTGSAKTAFSHWWIESQAQKNPKFTALFFNFEMDVETLMARSVARLTYENGEGITLDAICEGGADVERGLALWDECIGGRVEYFYCLRSREEIMAKVAQAVRYSKENGLNVPYVIMDYLQILPSTKQEERAAIQDNMKWLKTEIANRFNTVVLCITSMNRQSRNTENSEALNSALGSSSIEYDADAFMTIKGQDGSNIKTGKLHKARRAKPNTGRDIIFHGQYSAFVYDGDNQKQEKKRIIDMKERKSKRAKQKEAQDLFDLPAQNQEGSQ
jgi:replicative DNA helicase